MLLKAAVEKATSEFRSAPPTACEEVTKQHVKELRALGEHLVAKHQEELNTVTEAAIAKVKESQPVPVPAPGTGATPEDQKLRSMPRSQLPSQPRRPNRRADTMLPSKGCTEQPFGRQDEAQIEGYQGQGQGTREADQRMEKSDVITSETATESTSTSAPAASSSVPVASAASASAPSPTTAAPTRVGGAGASGIPRKPSLAITAAGTTSDQPARGSWSRWCTEKYWYLGYC